MQCSSCARWRTQQSDGCEVRVRLCPPAMPSSSLTPDLLLLARGLVADFPKSRAASPRTQPPLPPPHPVPPVRCCWCCARLDLQLEPSPPLLPRAGRRHCRRPAPLPADPGRAVDAEASQATRCSSSCTAPSRRRSPADAFHVAARARRLRSHSTLAEPDAWPVARTAPT